VPEASDRGVMSDATGSAPAAAASGGALDKPIAVTFFNDAAAWVKREESYTLRSLATRINTVTATRKTGLPWLKLARFGQLRTDKNSLRHDGNVIAISGIEADYDGGVVTVNDACELLTKQGLASVVYTSPSHTEDAPRWRVLCPLSEEVAADRRETMVGRLNGLFRGIFAGESFTLSQAYYFGSINRNPSHRVELIEGLPIDTCDDLDTIWIGKPGTSKHVTGVDPSAGLDVREDAELIRCVVTGQHFHNELCALAARYVGRNVPAVTVEGLLRGIMLSHSEDARDERWFDRFDSIPVLVASALRKFRAEDVEQPDPRRRETARAAFRLLRQRTPAAKLVAELHRLNDQAPEPLPAAVINRIAIWAARQHLEPHRA
jgi:hypothetical protein